MKTSERGLTESTVARKAPGIADIQVGERRVIAHEGWTSPVVLDPVAATVWSFLDGVTTMGDILSDLVEVFGGDAEVHWNLLCWLVEALRKDGFIDGNVGARPPRRVYPTIDASSCLGRKLGIGSAQHVRTSVADKHFRLSSTDKANGDLLDRIRATGAEIGPDDGSGMEMLFARITIGRRPRLQQLMDTLGNVVFASRDLDLARSAVESAVASLLLEARDEDAVFIECPAMWSAGGVVLVHLALREQVTGPLRQRLVDAGADFVPSTLLEVDRTADRISVRVPRLDGSVGPSHDVTGIATAGNGDPDRALNALAYLLRTWDQPHFDQLPALAAAPFVELPYECAPSTVVDSLTSLAQG